MVPVGLAAVALLVLLLPLLVKPVESQLEIFLLVMGAAAVTVSSRWSVSLLVEALTEPLKITVAVLAAGYLFRLLFRRLAQAVESLSARVGPPVLVFALIVLIGLFSSVITAIVAALVLVELVNHLRLERKAEVRVVVAACFSIGLGAALTPIGEPLSTIVVSKLSGEPYHARFFFLASSLWMYIIPGVLAFGALGAFHVRRPSARRSAKRGEAASGGREEPDTHRDILVRTAKVYGFVAGLVLLGAGFKPVIDAYVSRVPFLALFWINTISAFLDNATLAAAEIGPSLQMHQITAALLGLLAAGGMLIPGNIPNIIAAGKLRIRGRQWALAAIPAGLALMMIYFVILAALY